MLLGQKAWQGYLAQNRGLVACNLFVCERTHATNYKLCYVPLSQTSDYLKKHNLKTDSIDCLIDQVRTYRAEQEILVAMVRQGKINVCLLKNLAISPADCYRQVCNRWEEFYQEPRPVGKF